MKSKRMRIMTLMMVLALAFIQLPLAVAGDALPSWQKGKAKQAIIDFVKQVTRRNTPGYVKPSARIAVFDNDGTLWVEQPMYVQLAFALDRVKAMAPEHPEWQTTAPFDAALAGDLEGVMAGGTKSLLELIMTSHASITTDAFAATVMDWIQTARHPRFDRPYTDLVYQPMLEVLDYLRANGFKTYIVSGGGIEFMRPWTESVYGIPPEQVVGSSVKTRFEIKDGVPAIMRLPELNFIDDKEGKPVGINLHIGRRPIAAFGNSDGDLAMLQWAAAGKGPHFCLYVHHTDSAREWAYDRKSHIGKLDKGLDEARANGWTVADMKTDWKRVFSFEKN